MRQQGTCACWKGSYGFIIPLNDGGKSKIFVHQNDLDMEGYRELWPGDLVEYEVEPEERPHAVRVRLIQPASQPAEPAA